MSAIHSWQSFRGGSACQLDLFVVSPVPLMNSGIRVFAATYSPLANSDRGNDCQFLAVSGSLHICPRVFPQGRDSLAHRHVEHEEPTPISGCKELSVRGETHGSIRWIVTTEFPKVSAIHMVHQSAGVGFPDIQVARLALR